MHGQLGDVSREKEVVRNHKDINITEMKNEVVISRVDMVEGGRKRREKDTYTMLTLIQRKLK